MRLFFRNDDLGWDHKLFVRLLQSFASANQKLNVAAIPAREAGRQLMDFMR